MKATKRTGLERAERQILLGVPVLFAAGAAFHFLYGLSGGALLVGLLAPVNESVWEHLKLALWPQTLWWTAGYVLCARRQAADAAAWCAAALGALVATGCAMLLLFYFYTGAFGMELLWADIALFFLAVLLGTVDGAAPLSPGQQPVRAGAGAGADRAADGLCAAVHRAAGPAAVLRPGQRHAGDLPIMICLRAAPALRLTNGRETGTIFLKAEEKQSASGKAGTDRGRAGRTGLSFGIPGGQPH